MHLKPKKKLETPCYHWCVHCRCSIRDHVMSEFKRDLGRYEITCRCGKCPGYATDESRGMGGKEVKCRKSTKS